MTTPHTPAPSADDLQRFEAQLTDWLSGHLSAPDAQWMEALQRQHPALRAQSQVLIDLRHAVREAAAAESTDATWDLLMQKIAAEPAKEAAPAPLAAPMSAPVSAPVTAPGPRPTPARQPPRWLAWLWEHTQWANACAAAAVVAMVAPTAWMVWHTPAPGSETPTTGPAWRASPLDQLQPATPSAPTPTALAPWLEVQLHPDATAYTLADIHRLLGAGAQAAWQPQGAHRWVLSTPAAAAHSAPELHSVQSLPGVAAARWLPLVAPAGATDAPRPTTP